MAVKTCLKCKVKVSVKPFVSRVLGANRDTQARNCARFKFKSAFARCLYGFQNPVRCKMCQSCGNSFGRGGTRKNKPSGGSQEAEGGSRETDPGLEAAQVRNGSDSHKYTHITAPPPPPPLFVVQRCLNQMLKEMSSTLTCMKKKAELQPLGSSASGTGEATSMQDIRHGKDYHCTRSKD